MADSDPRFRLRAGGLNAVDSQEQKVILDEIGEKYFSTNTAGTILWNALETDRSPDELAALLVNEFEIEMSQARSDVDAFLDKLGYLNLIEETG